MKTRKIIVNADDFGLDEAVNYGIIKAYTDGIVSSTSIMANMPGFDHAVKLAKFHPGLHIGVHLNLNAYIPLTDGKTLRNADGMFDRRKFEECDEEEIYQEFCAQIEKVKASNIRFDHFDSHRHVHQSPVLKKVMERILETYPYPIRGSFEYPNSYPNQTVMNDVFYGDDASEEKMMMILKSLKPGILYDVVTHPAYIDNFLLKTSSYTISRAKELAILCSPRVQEAIKDLNIEITTYDYFKEMR